MDSLTDEDDTKQSERQRRRTSNNTEPEQSNERDTHDTQETTQLINHSSTNEESNELDETVETTFEIFMACSDTDSDDSSSDEENEQVPLSSSDEDDHQDDNDEDDYPDDEDEYNSTELLLPIEEEEEYTNNLIQSEEDNSNLSSSVSQLDTRPVVYINDDGEEFTGEQIEAMSSSVSSTASSLASSMMSSQELASPTSNLFSFLQQLTQQTAPVYIIPSSVHEEHSAHIDNNTSSSTSNNLTYNNLLMNDLNMLRQALQGSFHDISSQILASAMPPIPSSVSTQAHVPSIPIMRYSARIMPRATRPLHGRQIRRTRGFSGTAPSLIRLHNVNFTVDDYEMALNHLNSLIWDELDNIDDFLGMDDIHINILNVMLELWHLTERNRLCDFHDLVMAIATEYNDLQSRVTTSEFEQIPVDDLYEIVEHYILTEGRVPNVSDCLQIYEYSLLHHSYPSQEELDNFQERTLRFFLNATEFTLDDREPTPTHHIERLPVTIMTHNNSICTICQEEIAKGKEAITLLPCNHLFHANSQDCLQEGGSIRTWLASNNKCPMCKSTIRVPDSVSSDDHRANCDP